MTKPNEGNKAATQLEELELVDDKEPETPPTPLERILKALRGSFQPPQRPSPATRADLAKDKSKAFFMLLAAAVVVLLIFLALFSSPQKPKRREIPSEPKPDLGQRVTPGQRQKEAGSTTPLLSADTTDERPRTNDQITPDDINRITQRSPQVEVAKPNSTASALIPTSPPALTEAKASSRTAQQYELGQIDFSDPQVEKEYADAASTGRSVPTAPVVASASFAPDNDLKKPSLVFVRSGDADSNSNKAQATSSNASTLASNPLSIDSILPVGTRLIARLESPVSTAAAAPVVASVEYNYERDGQIVVPAGSKVLGKLQQANPSGFVSLHFDSVELPDGSTEKIDGTSMGLDFSPLKGSVAGRRRGAAFLVQALTGMGTAASFLVGGNNFNGPISESGLMREQLATNVGMAGQNELNQLALSQNIVVTVPGNTRFYVVLQKTTDAARNTQAAERSAHSAGESQSMPSLEELRQLLQLRQELSQLAQDQSTEKSSANPAEDQ